MEEARVITTEPLSPGEESMASFFDRDVLHSEAIDILRRHFVRRIIQRYYGVLPGVDSDGSCQSVLEDDDLDIARIITHWQGVHGDLEGRWRISERSPSSSGRSYHRDESL